MKNGTAKQARSESILGTWRQRVRVALVSAVIGVLAACGGGGGGGSASGGAENPTPPDLKTTVQSAVVKADVVSQIPSTLSAVAGQSSFTISSEQAASLPIGKIFIYNNKPFKVIGVNSADTTVVLEVQTPALDEMFDDLKMEIVSHAVQYDDAGKPITLAQAGLIKRAGMQLGLTSLLDGTKNCIQVNNDVSTTSQSGEDSFGYSFEVSCGLGTLLGVPGYDFVSVNGTLNYSAVNKRVIDIKAGTDFQQNDGEFAVAKLSVKIDTTDISALKTLAEKTSKCESKDGELTCEFSIRDGIPKVGFTPTTPPVPYTLTYGVRAKLTISASGEITLASYGKKWSRITGVKDHKKIVPEAIDSGFEGELSMEPNIEGELDLYVYGYMGAMAGFEGGNIVGAQISGGGYAKASGTFGNSEGSRCVSLEPGLRLGVEANFLTFGDNSLIALEGQSDYPFTKLSKSWPTECGLHRKVRLDYVIVGKSLYQADSAASSDGVDAYIAANDLIYQNNQVKNIVLDLSSTTVTDGYAFDVDAEVTDHSKNAVATYEARTDDFGVHRRVVVAPGDTRYGDTISLRIKAYIPEFPTTTAVTREIQIKIEDALSASPSYSKEIKTDGSEYWRVNHNYGGNTRALLTSANNISSVDGVSGIYKIEGGDLFDTTTVIGSENGNIPSQLVLKSSATSRGEGQAFNYVAFNTPTIDSIDMEPSAPEVGDVITFTVKGNRLPADYKVDIPNCLWVVEKRTAGNKTKNNYSTLQRVFQCKNTAVGTDLIAKFGDDEFPKVFSVVAETTNNFIYSPTTPKLGDRLQFWLRNLWGQVQSVVWTVYEGASEIVSDVSNGATTYWADFAAPYFSPGTQTVVVAYKDDEGTTLRRRSYQFELASNLTAPALTVSGKTQTSVSLGWTAVSGASYYALTRSGGTATATQSVVGISFTDTNVSANVAYSYSIQACDATACSVASTSVSVTTDAIVTPTTSKLPHTGITASQCYEAGSNTLVACSSAGALALNGQQDGHRADINAMSYSLVPNASGGNYSKEECVKDNVTGLIWEGKTASGLRAGGNTYTNYDVAYLGTQEQMDAATNSYGYAKAINDSALCGFTDWRLPTVDELQTIVDYSVPSPGPTLNSIWFVNTLRSSLYGSSSPYVGNPIYAWYIYFDDGLVTSYGGREGRQFVRLVRVSQ